ncbi:MAG: hypothetical protein V1851_02325 [Patescibacteria group bacterium]
MKKFQFPSVRKIPNRRETPCKKPTSAKKMGCRSASIQTILGIPVHSQDKKQQPKRNKHKKTLVVFDVQSLDINTQENLALDSNLEDAGQSLITKKENREPKITSCPEFVDSITVNEVNLPRNQTFTVSRRVQKMQVDGCFPAGGGYIDDIFLCEKHCRRADGGMVRCFKRDSPPKFRICLNDWCLVKGSLC